MVAKQCLLGSGPKAACGPTMADWSERHGPHHKLDVIQPKDSSCCSETRARPDACLPKAWYHLRQVEKKVTQMTTK